MALSFRQCRVCGAPLRLNPEKQSGVCDVCRRKPQRYQCLKCGLTLLTRSEKTGALCQRCATLQMRCKTCGKVVESAMEKSAGACAACIAEGTPLPRGRARRP